MTNKFEILALAQVARNVLGGIQGRMKGALKDSLDGKYRVLNSSDQMPKSAAVAPIQSLAFHT